MSTKMGQQKVLTFRRCHLLLKDGGFQLPFTEGNQLILLMEEILHHLGCIKPCKEWDKLPINWCRISSINSDSMVKILFLIFLPIFSGVSRNVVHQL